MPGLQARTAWLQASEMGAELAEVSSCRAVASSLAGFKGRCPLPSGEAPAAVVRGSQADGPRVVQCTSMVSSQGICGTIQREGYHYMGSVNTSRQDL